MRSAIPLDEQCVEMVSRSAGRWDIRGRCERRGVVERNGKLYCRQHDPRPR